MINLLQGEALKVLQTLPPASVNCVVTSPPYWGLRDYGTAKWKGGRIGCDHIQRMARRDTERETPGGRGGSFRGGTVQFADACPRCGAHRIDKQLGLERTPEEYVARIVAIFREVRRVLRDDGTLWLNLGDCYATGAGLVGKCPGGGAQGAAWRGSRGTHGGSAKQRATGNAVGPMIQPNRMPIAGLKTKDLVGIPWRVAFALQGDGWYLRADIIWSKPNAMPESVRDRPTKAHEYIFLLTKNARYSYDADAIKEPCLPDTPRRYVRGRRQPSNYPGGQTIAETLEPMRISPARSQRNRRSVWTITTNSGFKGAHFATFPPKLVEPCIRAGCPQGGTVLDPFAGASTTLLVAEQLGRDAIGIELKPAYVKMSRARLEAARGNTAVRKASA